ncbi:capsule biosynthesis protein [Mergibacter septicus]|uniref:Capsule biosynthesis protein n=2 Tax=Mergibacter septicus TaxID=221402 RepID=A0A8E3MGV2_9PAST|nr:capsule biosynthesis protein [Mergibacter septicus]QDJ14911.1 capsule biosynthesis protein [Mergibacter septicus]UTU47663.1 capsule biosynthesis protein [Mergibacter septicus]
MLFKMKIKANFNPLFWLLVIIPTFCSIIYFSFWASDMYVSESSFVVRSARSQNSLSSFGALLQGIGISRSQDDTYTVQSFIRSRNAVDELEKVLPLEKYYDKGDVFSRFAPFGFNNEKENFYQYFLKQQTINLDPISGIATLSISAFSAEDAQKINKELLKLAEQLINRLNQRARKDSLLFSQQSVKEAEERVNRSALALADYRVKNGIFDIKAQSEVQLELISKLQGELISLQTQLAQIRAISPNNPQINTLQIREKSIQTEMEKQIAVMLGKGDSIAHQTAEYQRLILENTLAQQQLTGALTSLQNAKDEIERQQLYLEVISKPNLPDLALLPYRIYSIISTLIFGLILYGIFSLLIASIREHKN